jgi:hypothetical protein
MLEIPIVLIFFVNGLFIIFSGVNVSYKQYCHTTNFTGHFMVDVIDSKEPKNNEIFFLSCRKLSRKPKKGGFLKFFIFFMINAIFR